MEKIKILSVEDDGDFAKLIQKTLEGVKDFELVGCCSSGRDALQKTIETGADIVLMDLNLGSGVEEGIQASRQIRLLTDARVIILSVYDEPELVVLACREAFACGYVLKTQFSFLVPTIRQTYLDSTPQSHLICDSILSVLSPAEKSVFYWMAGVRDMPNSSAKTVANQQTSVLHKLKLANRKTVMHVFGAYFGNGG